MNRFPIRICLAALLAALVALFLAACGGHSSRDADEESSSSSDSSSSSTSASASTAPDLDISGSWITYMDDTELGVTTFKMTSSGNLSGSLRTDSGETASLNGHLSEKEAEYTVSFRHRTFLVSADFANSSASGTLVDADGHVHAIKLNR